MSLEQSPVFGSWGGFPCPFGSWANSRALRSVILAQVRSRYKGVDRERVFAFVPLISSGCHPPFRDVAPILQVLLRLAKAGKVDLGGDEAYDSRACGRPEPGPERTKTE